VTVPVGVIDTSVFIASETGRRLDLVGRLDEAVVSVVTLAELQVGVLAAQDVETRARRLLTLDAVSDLEALPITEAAARECARMRVLLATAGRHVDVNDLWIAATAAAASMPVVTQDGDFDVLADLAGLSVVKV